MFTSTLELFTYSFYLQLSINQPVSQLSHFGKMKENKVMKSKQMVLIYKITVVKKKRTMNKKIQSYKYFEFLINTCYFRIIRLDPGNITSPLRGEINLPKDNY